MRKLFCFTFIFFALTMFAQEASKKDNLIIHLDCPNSVKAKLEQIKLDSVRGLTLTGVVDQRDICYLKMLLPYLNRVDLSDIQIAAYKTYPANYFPANGFSRKQESREPRFVEKIDDRSCQTEVFDKHRLELILPKSLIGIGAYAFSLPYITQMRLYEGLQCIDEGAFSTLRIEKLVIPRSVTTIKSEALSFLPNLKELTFEEGSQLQVLDDSLGFYLPFLAIGELLELDLSLCTHLKRIGKLISSDQLKKIILPPCLEKIDLQTLSCPNLEVLELRSSVPPEGKVGCLPKRCVVVVPSGCMEVYKRHKDWKYFTIVEFRQVSP